MVDKQKDVLGIEFLQKLYFTLCCVVCLWAFWLKCGVVLVPGVQLESVECRENDKNSATYRPEL